MPLPFIAQLIILIAIQVLSYVLTPKPKAAKPDAVDQAENPTAEAGRPIPRAWGSPRISETNVIGFWDKSTRQYKIKV